MYTHANKTALGHQLFSVWPFQVGSAVAYLLCIMKTRLYNFAPLKPHFCIVKLWFTGVYIIFFLFLLENINCGYSLEPSRRIFWAEMWKILELFYQNIFSFGGVFVMVCAVSYVVFVFSLFVHHPFFLCLERYVFLIVAFPGYLCLHFFTCMLKGVYSIFLISYLV